MGDTKATKLQLILVLIVVLRNSHDGLRKEHMTITLFPFMLALAIAIVGTKFFWWLESYNTKTMPDLLLSFL